MGTQLDRSIWVKNVFLGDNWAEDVTLTINNQGDITDCKFNTQPGVSTIIMDTMLPGITNLHSHAHQRAMAGLAETRGHHSSAEHDSFWSWRNIMYEHLGRIQPDDLKAIASQVYLEMLQSGFTGVAEFQYLHHDPAGHAYQDRAELTHQCHRAAIETGIGFTALPVLYAYSDFGAQPATAGQKRFLNNADQFAEIFHSLEKQIAESPNSSLGLAPHSLRAVDQTLLADTIAQCPQAEVIHIHIAEQPKEVAQCLAWSGQRPVEWLYEHFEITKRWCLIHATHMNDTEIKTLAGSNAVAGLCPTTEANLGDGFFPAVPYSAASGHWGIGSDSHISISPFEELRWLEYAQRLQTNKRNLLCAPEQRNTGRYLYQQALTGGAQATARKTGQIKPGFRADFIVVDPQHPRLYARKQDKLIDSLIFSGNENLIKDVYVGGIKVIDNGHHRHEQRIRHNFRTTLKRLADKR